VLVTDGEEFGRRAQGRSGRYDAAGVARYGQQRPAPGVEQRLGQHRIGTNEARQDWCGRRAMAGLEVQARLGRPVLKCSGTDGESVQAGLGEDSNVMF